MRTNLRHWPARLAALALLALVTACAPAIYHAGPPVTSAELNHDHWLAADGVRLPVRSWQPLRQPKAVVLALHGMNDYSNAFDSAGKFLSDRGIAVYAYDQRGFGQGPHPGYWSGAPDMAADLRDAAQLVARRHPGAPLYLLGESMGGAVVMLAVADAPPPEVSGIILSAPAVWGRADMGLFQRVALWMAYTFLPGWKLTGEGLQITPSDNIEMLRALSRDPLVIKGTRVDAVNGLVDLMDAAYAAAPRITLPTLVLYGEKDEIVPAAPTWDMVGKLPALKSLQRVALYDKGYHMLLRDLQAEVVLSDLAAWIADPSAPLPSGADNRAVTELRRRNGGP